MFAAAPEAASAFRCLCGRFVDQHDLVYDVAKLWRQRSVAPMEGVDQSHLHDA